MTKEEASRQYQIPVSVLDEYERWGLCDAVKKGMGNWQYDVTDTERIGIVMSLHDMGFDAEKIELYMRLLLCEEDTEDERLTMIVKKRGQLLDDTHFKEGPFLRFESKDRCYAGESFCFCRRKLKD